MANPLVRSDPTDPTEALATLAGSFRQLSDGFIADCGLQLELARAAGDEPGIVREHIKAEVMRAAQKMFRGSYRAATGRAAWDGEVSR